MYVKLSYYMNLSIGNLTTHHPLVRLSVYGRAPGSGGAPRGFGPARTACSSPSEKFVLVPCVIIYIYVYLSLSLYVYISI